MKHTRGRGGLSAFTAALFMNGCTARQIPPPRMPQRVMPTEVAEAPPPAAGEGRVVLDVANVPSRVDEVTARSEYTGVPQGMTVRSGGNYMVGGRQRQTRPLCLTPCAVNLTLGYHELLFSALDDDTHTSTGFVTAATAPSVVRHVLGRETSSVGGLVGALIMGGFGVSGILSGAVLEAIGDDPAHGQTGIATAGWITLGLGVALTAGAVALGLASRPTIQPGRTLQWTPQPATP